MIKILNDLPGNVLGFSAIGKITGTDYEAIVIPTLDEKLKTNQKIRMNTSWDPNLPVLIWEPCSTRQKWG